MSATERTTSMTFWLFRNTNMITVSNLVVNFINFYVSGRSHTTGVGGNSSTLRTESARCVRKPVQLTPLKCITHKCIIRLIA